MCGRPHVGSPHAGCNPEPIKTSDQRPILALPVTSMTSKVVGGPCHQHAKPFPMGPVALLGVLSLRRSRGPGHFSPNLSLSQRERFNRLRLGKSSTALSTLSTCQSHPVAPSLYAAPKHWTASFFCCLLPRYPGPCSYLGSGLIPTKFVALWTTDFPRRPLRLRAKDFACCALRSHIKLSSQYISLRITNIHKTEPFLESSSSPRRTLATDKMATHRHLPQRYNQFMIDDVPPRMTRFSLLHNRSEQKLTSDH